MTQDIKSMTYLQPVQPDRSYTQTFISDWAEIITKQYKVEFRPPKAGEKYIPNGYTTMNQTIANYDFMADQPRLVITGVIVNQIQEVYKTPTLDIPEGHKVIAFREPKTGDTYIDAILKEARPHGGSFFVSTIHPTNRVILEESYTEEIALDRLGFPSIGDKYWDDDSQKWSTATVQWGLLKRVIGKAVKKPCPASVFTQGDLDKLVK